MSGTGDNNLNQRLRQGQGDRGIGQQPTQTGPENQMSNRNRATRLTAAYQESARQERARLGQGPRHQQVSDSYDPRTSAGQARIAEMLTNSTVDFDAARRTTHSTGAPRLASATSRDGHDEPPHKTQRGLDPTEKGTSSGHQTKSFDVVRATYEPRLAQVPSGVNTQRSQTELVTSRDTIDTLQHWELTDGADLISENELKIAREGVQRFITVVETAPKDIQRFLIGGETGPKIQAIFLGVKPVYFDPDYDIHTDTKDDSTKKRESYRKHISNVESSYQRITDHIIDNDPSQDIDSMDPFRRDSTPLSEKSDLSEGNHAIFSHSSIRRELTTHPDNFKHSDSFITKILPDLMMDKTENLGLDNLIIMKGLLCGYPYEAVISSLQRNKEDSLSAKLLGREYISSNPDEIKTSKKKDDALFKLSGMEEFINTFKCKASKTNTSSFALGPAKWETSLSDDLSRSTSISDSYAPSDPKGKKRATSKDIERQRIQSDEALAHSLQQEEREIAFNQAPRTETSRTRQDQPLPQFYHDVFNPAPTSDIRTAPSNPTRDRGKTPNTGTPSFTLHPANWETPLGTSYHNSRLGPLPETASTSDAQQDASSFRATILALDYKKISKFSTSASHERSQSKNSENIKRLYDTIYRYSQPFFLELRSLKEETKGNHFFVHIMNQTH